MIFISFLPLLHKVLIVLKCFHFLVWFGLVWFGWIYTISTIFCCLMPNPVYTYILNKYDLACFFFFFWHTNHCWLFNAKSCLYIYIFYLYHTSSLMQRDGSSVMSPLGSWGISGFATSDPLTQMTQLALILLQLPSRQLTCTSTQEKKMTTEMAPYIILQQPIRANLF